MISGIATSPVVDKEKELVDSEAMKRAIPTFMATYPILHLDHSERPIGEIVECRVLTPGDIVLSPNHPDYDPDATVGSTYYKAHIKNDPELDDVWELIKSGKRSKISIYGVRTKTSPECKLLPHERVSACVTKGIRLWSFSVVSDNAINPGTYIKIAKSFSEDLCDDFEQSVNELIKAAFPDTTMAPKVVPGSDTPGDGNDPGVGTGDEVLNVKSDDMVKKAELDSVIQDVKGDMAELKTGITGILEYLKKSDTSSVPPKTDEMPTDYITKAALESTIDLIIKAKLESFESKITTLEKKVDEYGNQTIQKGGNIVFFTPDGSTSDEMGNPFLSNLDALEG